MSLLDAQLPDGWKWQIISDRYRVTKKSRNISYADFDTIPFVAMEAVPIGGQHEVRVDLREPKKISSGSYFEKGDVLLPKITPSFENGKQGIGTITSDFGVGSTELIPLQAIGDDSNLFLFFYLLHPEARHALAEKMEGSTGRQRIPEHVIRSFPVPIPPAAEQEKIAAVLWKVQRAIETEEKLVRTARELKQAIMHQLFTRGLRNEFQKETEIGPMPERWMPLDIATLCEIWSGGTPRKSIPEFWKGDIPWVSGKDLKSPSLDDAIDHVSVEGIDAGSRLAPSDSVFLLVRGMGLAKDLPVAVIKRPMAFNQDIKALVSRGDYSGDFLRSAIYHGKQRLLSKIVASAHGTMTLNLDDVATFKIACPSDVNEAQEIVNIIQTIDRKIAIHERKRATLRELFKTLLHKLMTGEIRVTDLDIDTSAVTINKSATINKKAKNTVRRNSMEYRPDESEILADMPEVKSAEFIATGGFKHVFRADINGKEEALKIAWLPEDEEDDERTRRVARLEREIDVLSKCTAPSLVKLASVQPATLRIAGRDYFVYSEEWLPGQPLTEVIKTGQQTTFDEALSLTTSLMEALSEINSTEHIHRDVKPANVMATGLADRPFVLLDLGIAFKVQGTELTGPGAGIAPGTTRYMAPESFSPSYKSSVDIRADIYSAGTTIFEFAAGKHPLVKKYEDVFTTRDRIMNYPPPKLETFRSDFPEWFCLLIDRTVKKNPSLRFRNPNAVLEEIKKNL